MKKVIVSIFAFMVTGLQLSAQTAADKVADKPETGGAVISKGSNPANVTEGRGVNTNTTAAPTLGTSGKRNVNTLPAKQRPVSSAPVISGEERKKPATEAPKN